MANDERGRGIRDLILAPGTYTYIQDGTSGRIKVCVGPTLVNLQANDIPIVFDFDKGKAEFRPVATLQDAVRKSIVVPDGFYAVLVNPVRLSNINSQNPSNHWPTDGEVKITPDLDVGNKIVVQGPMMFALWPGQSAKVIRGHHLHSNEFLVARVYNADAAQKSKGKVVFATTGQGEGENTSDTTGKTGESIKAVVASSDAQEPLSVGKLLIIKGTEVSFYIPPTGIAVLPETDENGQEVVPTRYVRDAITLEQLQYCVLKDENGSKRYVHGPAVVFPRPTEVFIKDAEGTSIFRAIELTKLQGIYVKVTRAYTDPVLGQLREGQEIFITGEQYPTYFPREEHFLVRYDGKTKFFAVAVPKGDARYVMDRGTGEISLVKGPQMLLPNPVTHSFVRRPLSEQQCEDWYPGNKEVLEWNRALLKLAESSPSTRTGTVTEGEIERGAKRKGSVGEAMHRYGRSGVMEDPSEVSIQTMSLQSANYMSSTPTTKALMDSSGLTNDGRKAMVDEFSRASTFTQPRILMLGGKFEGAIKIEVWTGFAVMIVNSKGERRVAEGPAKILLEYDETLEVVSLSTGKPKTTDKLIRTPYLRVKNNKVADIVQVETSDNVFVDIKLSYHVNFEGDPNKWWDVENYIKFLCDHMRSALKAKAKEIGIAEMYGNTLSIVRKVVLGEDLTGTTFEENGMIVSDVEVLATSLNDATVRDMLARTQKASLERMIVLTDKRRQLEATKETSEIRQQEMLIEASTATKKRELEKAAIFEELALALARIGYAIEEVSRKQDLVVQEKELARIATEADLALGKMQAAQRYEEEIASQKLAIELMVAESDAAIKRFAAISGGMSEALLTLSSQRTLADVAQALSVQKLVGGQNAVEVLGDIFKGTGLASLMEKIDIQASGKATNGNGDKKALTAPGA